MSPRSGYGAFDHASGYGAFAAPPAKANMSPRSGYGAFDNASGYGAFAPPPHGGLSPRSGYGDFDNASGYGAFAAPPEMSPRSGYEAFDNASGYGAFAAPPEGMSPRSGYDKFDDASGYGHFASPPDPNQIATKPFPSKVQTITDTVIHAKYQQAIHRVGGEQTVRRLWSAAGQTIWQRHAMRTELLQAVKRSFEKHERINHGYMTKAELKEALRDLACVFTDDQVKFSLDILDG
ncbi:hypothetical protein PHMEG_0002090 [Phytophthora megakarya]|uniref:EF-hand domain-containing protein n=1 Tax=Phytophthora megakarya TaxID=4795 RepID=A0A225X1J5_9STRA|nr:hypothetical protein PHMEG_0002090 [Phytophthora megakarya]